MGSIELLRALYEVDVAMYFFSLVLIRHNSRLPRPEDNLFRGDLQRKFGAGSGNTCHAACRKIYNSRSTYLYRSFPASLAEYNPEKTITQFDESARKFFQKGSCLGGPWCTKYILS